MREYRIQVTNHDTGEVHEDWVVAVSGNDAADLYLRRLWATGKLPHLGFVPQVLETRRPQVSLPG